MHDEEVFEAAPDDLEADGQAVAGEAAGDGGGGLAGEVEGVGEGVPAGRADFDAVHLVGVVLHGLGVLEGGDGHGGGHEDVDVAHEDFDARVHLTAIFVGGHVIAREDVLAFLDEFREVGGHFGRAVLFDVSEVAADGLDELDAFENFACHGEIGVVVADFASEFVENGYGLLENFSHARIDFCEAKVGGPCHADSVEVAVEVFQEVLARQGRGVHVARVVAAHDVEGEGAVGDGAGEGAVVG